MIPHDIDLDKLAGPKRDEHPANHRSDDAIYWNDDKTKFVLIYTIYEQGMGKYAGSIAWGKNKEIVTKSSKTQNEYLSYAGEDQNSSG